MWDMMGGGMMGAMTALFLVIPLLVIVLVAALIVWVIRAGYSAPHNQVTEAPLTILQRRYARGDLGTEEYERMRAALTKG